MMEGNEHGLKHMVPSVSSDVGTSITFVFDFVEATPIDGQLWAKHVTCMDEGSPTTPTFKLSCEDILWEDKMIPLQIATGHCWELSRINSISE